jgi:hypothetical protein
MPSQDEISRRKSPRIHYPPHLAPEIELGASRYTVVDLSEGGCTLAVAVPAHYRMGERVQGKLRFRDGVALPIDAYVLRSSTDDFVLEFLHPIPQGYINRETALFGSQNRDRRRFFRLRYQRVPGPTLVIRGGVQFQVVEISEAAIVLYCPSLEQFMKGQQIFGSLIYHDREPYPIVGNIFRMTRSEVIVLLARFIPSTRVMKEQQYVLQATRRL